MLNFFDYIIAIAIVMNARSMWTSIANFSSWISRANGILLLIGIAGCFLLSRARIGRLKNLPFIWVAFAIWGGVYAVFHPDYMNELLPQLIYQVCLFSYLYLKEENRFSVLFKYSDLITLIAVISVFFWVFGSQLGMISPTGLVYSSWGKHYARSYFNLYFEPQRILIGSRLIIRNCACFTEAPMAALNFGIALLVETFIREKRNSSRIVMLSIAIITTTATSGYLLMFFVWAYLLFSSKSKKALIRISKVLIVPLAIVVLGVMSYNLMTQKLSTESGNAHFLDFVVGFRTWRDAPVFGYGYLNDDIKNNTKYSIQGIGSGFSNSITTLLIDGGLYFFVVFIVAVVRSLRNTIRYRKYPYLFLLLGVLYLYTFVNCAYQWIIFIIFMLMMDRRNFGASMVGESLRTRVFGKT